MTEFFLGAAKMSTSNFLTCKSIFHSSEHHKFEYFSQPWWDMQVCEKNGFCIDESVMSSLEVIGSLYMEPGLKIGQYETEKSYIAL